MSGPMRGIALIALVPGLAIAAAASSKPPATERTGATVAARTDGERLFGYHCAPCHGPGPGHPGTAALQMKYGGSMPALLTRRTDLSADAIRYFVRNGVNAMPGYRKTEISDTELDALGTYLGR